MLTNKSDNDTMFPTGSCEMTVARPPWRVQGFAPPKKMLYIIIAYPHQTNCQFIIGLTYKNNHSHTSVCQ